MSRDARRDPSDLTVTEAVERWLGRKRGSLAEATVREYGYRLQRLADWADSVGIETVGELHPLDWDDYLAAREETGVKPLTMSKHFGTVREWAEFLEDLGAVEDGLAKAVPDVDVPRGSQVDDTMLSPADGDALIRAYRADSVLYGTRNHAILELFWFAAPRLGALRGLDMDDFHPNRRAVEFHHRPESGTPLKKNVDGERSVAIPRATAEVIQTYVEEHRVSRRDDHGRRPLFTSSQGRPSPDTIRNWAYLATQPCLRMDCPHEQERSTCEYVDHNRASQCPSSRSPHQIRTGAITRMLNRVPRDRVEHRANTHQWDHYDMAGENEKMEERDREVVRDLTLYGDDDE